MPVRSAAEEKWTFLSPSPLFQPLIGDLQEPSMGVVAYGSQARYEGAVGATVEFLRFEAPDATRWAWGILGDGFILLDQYGATFPMRGADWQGGMYLSGALGSPAGVMSYRLEYVHESAHLGDSLEYVREPTFFSRENFNLVCSYHGPNFRVYYGLGFWVNGAPSGRPFFASLGTELYTPPSDLIGIFMRGYAACHLRWKDETDGILNKTFQLGTQWRFDREGTKAVRLALVYFDGLSEFGQFYRERDEHWGFAVYFDP